MTATRAIASHHAQLLVLLAEHTPVASRHLLDDSLTVECCCGNPLYVGHLVVLLTRLNEGAAS